MFTHSSVKRLLTHRKSGCDQMTEGVCEKVIKSLVKKLKSQEINQLEEALSSRNHYSKCICISR